MTCQHHWKLNNDNPPVGVCLKCDEVREFPTPDLAIKYGGWTPGLYARDGLNEIISRAVEQADGHRR